ELPTSVAGGWCGWHPSAAADGTECALGLAWIRAGPSGLRSWRTAQCAARYEKTSEAGDGPANSGGAPRLRNAPGPWLVENGGFPVRFLLFHDNYRLLAASCLHIKSLDGKSQLSCSYPVPFLSSWNQLLAAAS